jgi:peptidyl-prolyl cis-trans isomerase SurA
MRRYHVVVSDSEVNNAYKKFAEGNHLSAGQLTTILNRAGVTAAHFKDYVRTQIGWGRVLQKRFRVVGMISEQEAVQRMLKDGGVKPKATEYTLQQVIFVIPSKQKRALLAKRRREAQALRSQFTDCGATRQLVLSKKLIDVTVRDLGRVLGPALPPDWAKLVKATSAGHTTKLRDTNRGVEFIAVCKTDVVSDDRVAQLVFSSEDGSAEKKAEKMRSEYIKELREKAHIEKR